MAVIKVIEVRPGPKIALKIRGIRMSGKDLTRPTAALTARLKSCPRYPAAAPRDLARHEPNARHHRKGERQHAAQHDRIVALAQDADQQ